MTKPNCSDSAPNNIYTLTLNGNGGKLNWWDLFQNYDMRAGSQLSILSRKPTRDGYTFQWWNTQCNWKWGGYNSSDTMPLKNLSLCAVRSKTCDKYEISRNNIWQCGIEPWWVHPEYNWAGLPEYFSSYESCVDFWWAAWGKEQYEVAPDQYVPCFSCTCKTDSNDTNPNNSACRLIKNWWYESQCQYNTTFPKSITYSACNTDMWKYWAIIWNSFSGITSQSQCPRWTLCIPCVVCSCS